MLGFLKRGQSITRISFDPPKEQTGREGLALVLGFALAGSLPLLRAKPAQALRDL